LNNGGEFVSRRSGKQFLRAKHAGENETFRLTLSAKELAVIHPVTRRTADIRKRGIHRKGALIGLCCRCGVSHSFL
jgi:hypothetical protein